MTKELDVMNLTEEQARTLLESLRWPAGVPVCPHCKSHKAGRVEGKSARAGLYQCKDCRKQYTVTVGTIFEDSHLPLRTWMRGFHLICSSKKGISAAQVGRMLGITYKTAWYLSHRIRHVMNNGTFDTQYGMLEQINIHGRAHLFVIYPTVGAREVRCSFPPELQKRAIEGIGKYVGVSGKLRYKKRDRFPNAVDVAGIEIHPEEKELPSIFDLRGIAKGATGNLSSEKFIRNLRNASA